MKKLFNPYWIIITVSVPQVILILLFMSTYRVIHTLLSEESLFYWKIYGSILITILLIFTSYAIFSIRKKHQIHPLYSLAVFLAYIPFLYAYLNDANKLIPWDIPRWMLFSGDIQLYAYTFIMPALFHALWILVLYSAPRSKEHHAWYNFFGALAVPLAWYLIFTVLIPLLNQLSFAGRIFEHIYAIILVSSTVVFLFLVFRFVYIITSRYPSFLAKYDIVWKVIVTVIFPLLGLWLNNEKFDYIFGDFSNSLFYIIALINGILICIPDVQNYYFRYLLFICRSITFPFIIYFLLVLMPYLPLSIPAIIFFGAGFLMLTPMAVTIIQSWVLSEDYHFLKHNSSHKLLTLSFILSLLVIPALLLYSYQQDKITLNQALNHVYETNYTPKTQKNIRVKRIIRTLENIKKSKNNGRNNFGFSINYKPFLSNLYQTWVLENLTLSNAKIRTLENVFVGDSYLQDNSNWFVPTPSDSVHIDSIRVESKFDDKTHSWTSWIHLGITNKSGTQQEFATQFDLPSGSWISNYYLMIEDRKEFGILAEKKAARWVYNRIVGRRRDPGILQYTHGNEIEFRVFPFAAKETRITGIELIHKEPVQFEIAGKQVFLGKKQAKYFLHKPVHLKNIYYIPENVKKQLPKTKRKPYYHFMVDCSVHQTKTAAEIQTEIQKLLNKKMIASSKAKISLVNYQSTEYNLTDNWKAAFKKQHGQGGFYLEYALKSMLLQQYQNPSDWYPIPVILAEDLNQAVFTDGLKNFLHIAPENNNFYVLKDQANLVPYSLLSISPTVPESTIIQKLPKPTVYAFPNVQNPIAYLPDEPGAAVVLEDTQFDYTNFDLDGKTWENALLLEGINQSLIFNPYKSNKLWVPTVKNSFRTEIMTPFTSYLAVENEAQKQALLEKQKQTLSGKKSLDTDEERRMSEPSFILLLALLVLVLGIKYFSKKRSNTPVNQSV